MKVFVNNAYIYKVRDECCYCYYPTRWYCCFGKHALNKPEFSLQRGNTLYQAPSSVKYQTDRLVCPMYS